MTNSVSITVNGSQVQATVEGRTSLADFLRDGLDLTATHLACEHGVCGACTVLLDGEPVRSCITLAAATDGRSVQTLEAFDDDDLLNEIRACFSEAHGLQCGFCTSGMLLTTRDIIMRGSATTDAEIRLALSGNLCRCTGYAGIVQAVRLARSRLEAKTESGAGE